MKTIDLNTLQSAVAGTAAAIRIVTKLEPVGHSRDKVFPPTYAGGEYATEKRYPAIETKDDDQPLQSVLLHSVAGEANLLEEALKAAIQDGFLKVDGKNIDIPLLEVNFNDTSAADYVPEPITVLDAPHRVFDAIFRDSEVSGQGEASSTLFRDTEAGKDIGKASLANATPLYQWSPTSLLFGCWNSANDKVPGKIKGNLKFARAIASEIVGYGIEQGVRVGGKIDSLGITRLPIFEDENGNWTPIEENARRENDNPIKFKVKKNAKGVPSEILHGNIAPSIGGAGEEDATGGGITMKYAIQTTVLSLSALRRMRFPYYPTNANKESENSDESNPELERTPEDDTAARTVLTALGLVAITAQRERDYFLRSRCELRAVDSPPFEFVPQGREVSDSDRFTLSFEQAVKLLKEAIDKASNLKWKADMPKLRPKDNLAELIRLSHERGGAEDQEQAEPSSE